MLAECIDSVLEQTYQNWEYIIVDNCSTDGSTEIAQSYAEEGSTDPRCEKYWSSVKAIPNHNTALRQMAPESKYCKVVFADDRIFPECIERMVGVAEAFRR